MSAVLKFLGTTPVTKVSGQRDKLASLLEGDRAALVAAEKSEADAQAARLAAIENGEGDLRKLSAAVLDAHAEVVALRAILEDRQTALAAAEAALVAAKRAADEAELARLVRVAEDEKQKAEKELTVELRKIREIVAPSFLAASAARDLATALKAKHIPWDLGVNVADVAGDLNEAFRKSGGGPHTVVELSLLVPLKKD